VNALFEGCAVHCVYLCVTLRVLNAYFLGGRGVTRKCGWTCYVGVCRVGQNCIYTLYMTVLLVVSLPKVPYVHRVFRVLVNPRCVLLAGA
jgi:hypothetical protein